MPIFTKKFAPKVSPPRTNRLDIGCPQIQEDLDEYKNISLNLVDKQICFIDGVWMTSTTKGNAGGFDDMMKMKRKMKTLEQENNLLQVKMDVLLDLLTENTLQLNEMKK